MAGGAQSQVLLLQILCYVEVLFGSWVVYCRSLAARGSDQDGTSVVLLGAFIMMYGQVMLVYTIRTRVQSMKIPIGAALFAKAMLAVGSLAMAILMVEGARHNHKPTLQFALFLYAVLGLPFAAVVHRVTRNAWDEERARLAGMSQAERSERQKQLQPPPSMSAPEPYMQHAGGPQFTGPPQGGWEGNMTMSAGVAPPGPTWG
mmetsp:Transcript_2269/g.4744  ORF Transcript_2269/g.4744 Transcript_2269/m.4744 type:complete len:203 (-) Transcript_2269:26-634(-)